MQYKARILGLMEGKDPVAVQRETAVHLAQLIDGVPVEKLCQVHCGFALNSDRV